MQSMTSFRDKCITSLLYSVNGSCARTTRGSLGVVSNHFLMHGTFLGGLITTETSD